jgi:hypothetical protein
MSTDWKKAMREASANAEKAKDRAEADAWHMVAGCIAEAAGLAKSACPCGRSLKTPSYCPLFGDHKD